MDPSENPYQPTIQDPERAPASLRVAWVSEGFVVLCAIANVVAGALGSEFSGFSATYAIAELCLFIMIPGLLSLVLTLIIAPFGGATTVRLLWCLTICNVLWGGLLLVGTVTLLIVP